MARVKRSRSRDFRREQKKQETLLTDPDREIEERREKRQEQLKNDKRVARMRAKEAKEEARRAAKRAKRRASVAVDGASDGDDSVPQPLTPRERAQRRRTRFIYAAVLLVTLFFLGTAAWKAVQVKAEEAAALEREQQLQLQLGKLQDELNRIDTAEYIEEKARTELHMIFPGETIYIINGREEKTE